MVFLLNVYVNVVQSDCVDWLHIHIDHKHVVLVMKMYLVVKILMNDHEEMSLEAVEVDLVVVDDDVVDDVRDLYCCPD